MYFSKYIWHFNLDCEIIHVICWVIIYNITLPARMFFFFAFRESWKKKILKWPGTDFESYIKKVLQCGKMLQKATCCMEKFHCNGYMVKKKKTRLKSLICSARLLDLIEKWDKLKKACAKKNSSNYLNFLRFVFLTNIR